MPYNQYYNTPITGYDESIKNRVNSNSNALGSYDSFFPDKFDLFSNKENTSSGPFAVTEEHALTELQGNKLYLYHRPSVDENGTISSITASDGTVDENQTDVMDGSIIFAPAPVTPTFNVFYTAAGDSVQDSHVNALQNTVMSIQETLGLRAPDGADGVGLVSLDLVVSSNPATEGAYEAIKAIVPNATMLRHLQGDLHISSTDIVGTPGYGNSGTIYIGQTGVVSKNNVHIDANTFTVATTNGLAGSPGGTYRIGLTTGDSVGISGKVTIASRTVIGASGGAGFTYEGTVPGGAQAFYDAAALVVHGPIWFGSGLSGNGSIVFTTTSGSSVDIQGDLNTTNLTVASNAVFNGISLFNGFVGIVYPGYLQVNSDIVMNDRNGIPSRIDGLDPSYATSVLNNPGRCGEIVSSLRSPITAAAVAPYTSGARNHPQLGYKMYPIIGGWTYTGTIAAAKSAISGDKNILLLNTNMSGVGGYLAQGGGETTLNYGDYCTGLFNPGDTFIEIAGVSDLDAYSYPIYSHKAHMTPSAPYIATGLSIYVVADDNALNSSIAGLNYRLYQPGNVPLYHLSTNGSTTAQYGKLDSTYPGGRVSATTNRSWLGGSRVLNNNSQFKSLQGAVSTSITEALNKSVNNSSINGKTGIAYIYLACSENNSTVESYAQLRASPTPYGLAGPSMQTTNPPITPGQYLAVGEIVAVGSGGNWVVTEVTSYRDNGYYDSCWIPLIRIWPPDSSNVNHKIGRTLPFYDYSMAPQSQSFGDIYQDGFYTFWVEHNLGPSPSKSDLDFRIFIASYSNKAYDTNIATNSKDTTFQMSAAGNQNLWTPWGHRRGGYQPPGFSGIKAGALKEITSKFQISYIDTRFMQLIYEGNTQDAQVFNGYGGEKSSYIRVMVRRIR